MIRKGNFNVEVEQVHFLILSQSLAWLVEPEKIRACDNIPRACFEFELFLKKREPSSTGLL